MALLIALILIALLFGGFGFLVHALWIVAALVAIVLLVRLLSGGRV